MISSSREPVDSVHVGETNVSSSSLPAVSSEGVELCLAIRRTLSQSPYRPLRQVRCDTRHGKLVLSGSVPSFHLVQMAQTIAVQAAGKDRVVSELRVVEESPEEIRPK